MTGRRTHEAKKRKRDRKAKRLQHENAPKRNFDTEPVNREHEKLIQWLDTVKFRKVLFGGVDEVQLWKKLEELDRLYESALVAERARYDALLEEQTMAVDAGTFTYEEEPEISDDSGQNGRTADSGLMPGGEE